jgi:hypothetical protein
MRIHESSVPVPTWETTSSQVGKEIKVLYGYRAEKLLLDQRTSSFKTSRGGRMIREERGRE